MMKKAVLFFACAVTPGEAEGINDSYDLYSWDGGTQSDIPYQEAGGEGLPIGRGNSWYYFDESSGEYLPW